MQTSLDYAKAHSAEFVSHLIEFLRIPSISTLPEYQGEVLRAAHWLAADLSRIGMENVQLFETPGHPIVYADWLHAGDDKSTVLIYGHYDVQPVDPLDEWRNPPFEPVIENGDIYARGTTDDKGQVLLHVKVLESILGATSALPVNIKVLFEGEEETGSINLDNFVADQREFLRADSVLISDTSWIAAGQPSIPYSVRGIAGAEIHVYGPKTDLHSGGYGGTVHNPAVVLAEIISQLHDNQGRVLIPGFYDTVRILSESERAELARVPYSLEEWQARTGVTKPWGEPDFTLIERTGVRPTCEVNGMWSGFTGEGSKTIIPAEAHAKITMRLVANQDPIDVLQQFSAYILSIAPDDVVVSVESSADNAWPATTAIDSQEMQIARQVYEDVWGLPPVFYPGGGSIPVVATFQKELSIPVVMMGFGLPGAGIHGPNEWFRLDQYHKGIEAVIRYYYQLSELERE